MEMSRLKELAGVDFDPTEKEIDGLLTEADLMEKVYSNKYGMSIDTDQSLIDEIQKRMEAASRALGLANKLKNPEYKRKHLSRIMTHMNTIRSALHYMIKQLPPVE